MALFDYNWFMYFFFPLVGMICLIAGPPVFLIFWKKMVPWPARKLTWAKRRGTPLLLVVHDSARAELTTIKELRGGIVRTEDGVYKLLPKLSSKRSSFPLTSKEIEEIARREIEGEVEGEVDGEEDVLDDGGSGGLNVDVGGGRFGIDPGVHPFGNPFAPSPSIDRRIEPMNEYEKTIYNDYFVEYSNWINKRCSLRGVDLPLFIGYSGKGCLMNPLGLALYESGQICVEIDGHLHWSEQKGKVHLSESIPQPLIPLDARVINNIINQGFDETQMSAIVTDAENRGKLDRGFGAYIPLMSVITIVIIAIILISMLPNIM